MGGFNEPNAPDPAPDYPPDNDIDMGALFYKVQSTLKDLGMVSPDGRMNLTHEPGWLEKELISIVKDMGQDLGMIFGAWTEALEPTLKAALGAVMQGIEPITGLGGDLAYSFVSILVDGLSGMTPTAESGNLTGLAPAAQAMFDRILAPLAGLTAAANPSTSGAGIENAQRALGGIVAVHLHTWIVNILANLTGLGVLKYINSFDECVTGSLNARALGRGAMRPYLDTFIAKPLQADLYTALPLEVGSTAQLVKRYIRGNMSGDDLKRELRKRGYDDSVVEDMMLDAAKLLDTAAIVYLAKHGTWTDDQCIQALQQAGYPETFAKAVFYYQYDALVRDQTEVLADELVTLTKDRRMDTAGLGDALQKMGFTDEEVSIYKQRAAYAQEIPRRISYTQVKNLYQESLVDLDYVLAFLRDEGYSTDDANLLALLDFTKKQDRDKTKAYLLAKDRATLEAALKQQAAADEDRNKALAALGG
jgi:hypothetical protein